MEEIQRTEKVVWGTGEIGRLAVSLLQQQGVRVKYFIDNNAEMHEKTVNGIAVKDVSYYLEKHEMAEIVVACSCVFHDEIRKQLGELSITNYDFFDRNIEYERERLLSYCKRGGMEDVILYHVLKNENNIFYIDVGSNDPVFGSVTKLLYDMKEACGINIDPQEEVIGITNLERPRDINLCVGIGKENKETIFYLQGGLATGRADYVVTENCKKKRIEIKPLADIVKEYIAEKQEIQLLKIDVEGMEKEVLEGADFSNCRPWIICIESTLPMTSISNYEIWEEILYKNQYLLAFSHGVNRYYLAEERRELANRFVGIEELRRIYNIFYMERNGYNTRWN